MDNHYTDEQLINSILDGNEEYQVELVRRYQDFAFNLTFKILRNREDAEESVQDSFVKALKALPAFKKQSAFKTWLYRIVYTTAINRIRNKKQVADASVDDINGEQLAADQHPSDATYDQKVYSRMVQAAFDKLSPENRTIMMLFYIEHYTIEEIASITLFTENVVKVRLHRSREQIKTLLANYKPGS